MKKLRWSSVFAWAIGTPASVVLSATVLVQAAEIEPAVNAELRKFQQRFDPELVQLGERVRMAFGYEYSNFSFVEGDDGVIVIDTGWHRDAVRPAIAAYRKITDKPIKAIVYTHVHGDHLGGADLFMAHAESLNIPILADSRWRERMEYDLSNVRLMIYERANAQMGILLPPGEAGTVGAGVGPVTRADGGSSFVPPNRLVEGELDITIAGVRMILMHAAGDIDSHLIVWLPDDKVMFAGDSLGGTLPYVATPRFEPDRDPRKFIKTIETMMSYPVEYIAPGHGRPLLGKADVDDVLKSNRDVIQFIADQVERYVVKGYSADQIIDTFALPPHLAMHPDLQARYHRLPWLIRGLYTKHAGWVGETLDLARHTDSEEARRLVNLLGGNAETLRLAEDALESGDPRWAASLATYVLRIDSGNVTAKQLKIDAFRTIAYSTDSANERNYLLTDVLGMEREMPWARIFAAKELQSAAAMSSEQILRGMSSRFKAEHAMEESFSISVNIREEASRHLLSVNKGLLLYESGAADGPDAEMELSREALNRLSARLATWAEAIEDGEITVLRGEAIANQFATLVE